MRNWYFVLRFICLSIHHGLEAFHIEKGFSGGAGHAKAANQKKDHIG